PFAEAGQCTGVCAERVAQLVASWELPLDSDYDGILDDADWCSSTPFGERVDANGCAASQDSDRDGVFDEMDSCPNTPMGALADESGCPYDSDDDGIYDGLDRCEDTPAGE